MLRKCRHCGEEFDAPKPPAKPFGKFMDECPDCAASVYSPTSAKETDEQRKKREAGEILERIAKKRGVPRSVIATVMRTYREGEPSDD